MYEKLKSSCSYIQSIKKSSPTVGIILGSGLGNFVNKLDNCTIIKQIEIPYFCEATVEGHKGNLILGQIGHTKVIIQQGRLHAYEGHKMSEVVYPLRVMAALGIKDCLVTNASGGIHSDLNPGDLAIISDHINLMGPGPLIGKNDQRLGPRFPDMSQAYNQEMALKIKNAAKKNNYQIKQGVYAGLLGPSYETPAEIRMLQALGADMVGMSTIPEVIVANHLGLRVAGISCITNKAAGLGSEKLDHQDVKKQADQVIDLFSNILFDTIENL